MDVTPTRCCADRSPLGFCRHLAQQALNRHRRLVGARVLCYPLRGRAIRCVGTCPSEDTSGLDWAHYRSSAYSAPLWPSAKFYRSHGVDKPRLALPHFAVSAASAGHPRILLLADHYRTITVRLLVGRGVGTIRAVQSPQARCPGSTAQRFFGVSASHIGHGFTQHHPAACQRILTRCWLWVHYSVNSLNKRHQTGVRRFHHRIFKRW